MIDEDDLLPLSGLQHFLYCERQWALIHVEGQWAENRFTAEGALLHKRAHEPSAESRGDVRTVRGLRLRSLRLGLSGVADIVEYHRVEPGSPGSAAAPKLSGSWRAVPVEYKRGKPKPLPVDKVQLCAQAICLEEMLPGLAIPEAFLYYGETRHRLAVPLDDALRSLTEGLAERMRGLFEARRVPPAEYAKKCDNCSLIERCRPKDADGSKRASRYLARAIAETLAEPDGFQGGSP